MSENRQFLIDLSVDRAGEEARFHEVRSWFRGNGWSTPDERWTGYPDKFPADPFGPRSLEFGAEEYDGYTFIAGRDFYHAGENTQGPFCARCTRQYDFDLALPVLADWYNNGTSEPELSCPECGWTGLFGNWNIVTSAAVAYFGIGFDPGRIDPEPLGKALVEGLHTDVGGRWAHIIQRT